jgi:hypothetical protein
MEKTSEEIENLLKQLKNYPVLVVKPDKKNKYNIVQILKLIPNEITKIIIGSLPKRIAENTVNLHNQNITNNN